MALWSKRLAIKDTMDPSGGLSDKIQNKGQGAERMVNKQLAEPTEGPGWGSGAAAFCPLRKSVTSAPAACPSKLSMFTGGRTWLPGSH